MLGREMATSTRSTGNRRDRTRQGRWLRVSFCAVAFFALSAAAAAQSLDPGGTFIDDDGNVHEGMIEAIVAEGITLGCDPTGERYCPADHVTRGQMASFLSRAFSLPPGPDRFADDDRSTHEPAIDAVAAAGITLGCSPEDAARFCPEADVTRGQMAAFLTRAMNLPIPATTNRFTDDDGSTFEGAIEAISAAGITTGCDATDPTRFCPFDAVRRDQMATFIGRALGLTAVPPPPRLTAQERMVADVSTLTSFGPRVAGSDAERAAGDWIAEAYRTIVGDATTVDVALPNGLTSRNVSTSIGTGATAVLIGAHYDSVALSPGADDNASGVAVTLELARNLAGHPPDGLEVTFIAFGAEERLDGFSSDDHHFGSRQHAADLQAAAALPDAMVSVDMVGFGADLWAVTYLDQLAETADQLVSAGSGAGIEVTRMARGDISDHEAFVRAGVPAAFLWRPDNAAWHTADDTTVRAEALGEDLAVMLAWLDLVMEATKQPEGIE